MDKTLLRVVSSFIEDLDNLRTDMWSHKHGAEVRKELADKLDNALLFIPSWIEALRKSAETPNAD